MYQVNGLYTLTVNGVQVFQGANPAGGVPQGTQITPAWLNDVQGELLNVLQSTGITPAESTSTQVFQGIKRVAGGNITTVTATTTLTADNAGLVLVNAAGGNVALTLPAVSGAGGVPLPFTIIRTDTSGNAVTYATAGADELQPSGLTGGSIGVGGEIDLVGDGVGNWWAPGNGRLLNIRSFTSSTTYAETPGTKSIVAFGQAAGGGGGASGPTSSSQIVTAGGGGQGGNFVHRMTSGFSGLAITVGAGGLGGQAATLGGSAGGTTSFGGASATGGMGGSSFGSAAATICPGGMGGTSSGASVANNSGAPGQIGQGVFASGFWFSGAGGGNGGGIGSLGESTGTNATGFGGGGGGACSGPSDTLHLGGNGSGGRLIIFEYS